MHSKLRETHPGYKMPSLPINAAAIPPPPKRKSAFLNTLSRFASPASKASQRSASGRHTSATSSVSSALPTPLASPKLELNDPFSEADDEDDLQPPIPPANSTITALAAYLTSVANDAVLRQSRVWKRFNRVRTDDLQSVRVERAIKRVRSDIAAHASPSSSADGHQSISQVVNGDAVKSVTNGNGVRAAPETAPSLQEDITEDVVGEAETTTPSGTSVDGAEEGTEVEQDRAPTPRSPKPSSSTVETATNGAEGGGEEAIPTHRIPRSQSAEPMLRASRVYLASPPESEATSSRTSQAGESADDSSISTTGRTSSRKKRSKSMDPNAVGKKSQRKVVVDDFEMMRVLGKGCAGKVLLVRHKPTQDVFALKAITKRHVLAHQELQHTLTEQAVLKRMAAEGSDPFVVKLWWSFHDKENLFLVMVRCGCAASGVSIAYHDRRTSIPEVIWLHSWRVGAAWGAIARGSTQPRSSRALRACTQPASSTATSSRRTSSLPLTGTSSSRTLVYQKSSRAGMLPSRRHQRHPASVVTSPRARRRLQHLIG